MAEEKKLTQEEFDQLMINAIRETDKDYMPPTERKAKPKAELTQEEIEALIEAADSLDDE